jgi:cell wall-associated NlpC family hydrolase
VTTKEQIVAVARETLGTKYQHQQRLNGIAMDCAGVPAYVATRLGLSFDDNTSYGRLPVPKQMRSEIDKRLVRVHKRDMQPGDLAWIQFDVYPQHFAIVGDCVYGGMTLIHAYNGAGLNKVVEHRIDEQWNRRIVGVWRFPGVTV